MKKYVFIGGRNQELSLAELGIFGEKIEICDGFAITTANIDAPQDFLNRIGGCVEIIEIIEENIASNDIEKVAAEFLYEKFEGQKGKCAFGINLMPEERNPKILRPLLLRLKKSLRSRGIRANFLNKDFRNVNRVFVAKQKIIERGANLHIIRKDDSRMMLGITVAIQDIDAYAKRDYGKPFRDAKIGMLPPKLAQIMINLAAKDGKIIWDPFCGTGTILMEAMLMGYSVIGSDYDTRIVEGAKKNIAWLREQFHISPKITSDISQANATSISSIPNTQTGTLTIITEPHLGPPLSTFPAQNFLEKVIAELSDLYMRFFENLSQLQCPIIIIFPYWRKNAVERVRLSEGIIDKIKTLGYSKTTFVPLQTDSLFYERPDQIVGREIVRFTHSGVAQW